jgi:protein required for attachment to host cells
MSRLMKTWILVANAARARLFEAGERDGQLVELAGFASPDSRLHGSDFTSEPAGRVQESASSARHGIEPPQDPHEKASLQFAHGLAQILERGRLEHEYEQLVLVAAPRFLGQLRGSLDAQVARLVTRSVDKDVSRAGVEEIEAMLGI